MRKTVIIMSALLALCSCSKEQRPSAGEELSGSPICFDGFDANVETKTARTASTSISTLHVTASTGTSGSSDAKWPASGTAMSNASVTLSSGTGASGYYWPAEATSMNFYATSWSVAPTMASSGPTASVTAGTTDYMAGAAKAVSSADYIGTTTPVPVTMNHILAWLSDIKLTTSAEGLTATITSIKVTPAYKTRTYNLAKGTFSGGTANSTATTLTAPSGGWASIPYNTSFTSVGSYTGDTFWIPGDVTISVTYTVSGNGYTSGSLTKSATVSLAAGKKSTVTGTLPTDASPIRFSVTCTAWGTATVNAGTLS